MVGSQKRNRECEEYNVSNKRIRIEQVKQEVQPKQRVTERLQQHETILTEILRKQASLEFTVPSSVPQRVNYEKLLLNSKNNNNSKNEITSNNNNMSHNHESTISLLSNREYQKMRDQVTKKLIQSYLVLKQNNIHDRKQIKNDPCIVRAMINCSTKELQQELNMKIELPCDCIVQVKSIVPGIQFCPKCNNRRVQVRYDWCNHTVHVNKATN
jgi:hypothetical protein